MTTSTDCDIPDEWTRTDLEQLADDLERSVQVRTDELVRLGEDGPHRRRLQEEVRLLQEVKKALGSS